MKQKIESVIANRSKEINHVDNDLMMEVVGVNMAIDHLRKALDKVEECLDKRKYEQASSLGYSDVSSEFIFLQRTLGGLLDSVHKSQSLISDIAVESGSNNYEETFAVVKPHMQSLQPKKKPNAEEVEEGKRKLEEMMKKYRHARE